MRLHVGNLPVETSAEQLTEMVTPYGMVKSSEIVLDSQTGLSRGYGFVVLGSDDEGRAACKGLNGSDYKGNVLKVG
jgi:cold-inducible RNA-binding protein